MDMKDRETPSLGPNDLVRGYNIGMGDGYGNALWEIVSSGDGKGSGPSHPGCSGDGWGKGTSDRNKR